MLCTVQEAELEELGEGEGMNLGLHFADEFSVALSH